MAAIYSLPKINRARQNSSPKHSLRPGRDYSIASRSDRSAIRVQNQSQQLGSHGPQHDRHAFWSSHKLSRNRVRAFPLRSNLTSCCSTRISTANTPPSRILRLRIWRWRCSMFQLCEWKCFDKIGVTSRRICRQTWRRWAPNEVAWRHAGLVRSGRSAMIWS